MLGMLCIVLVIQNSHKPGLSVEPYKATRTGLICSQQHYISHALEAPKELFSYIALWTLVKHCLDTTTFIIVITEISTKWRIFEPSYSADPAVVKFPRGNEGRLRTFKKKNK